MVKDTSIEKHKTLQLKWLAYGWSFSIQVWWAWGSSGY